QNNEELVQISHEQLALGKYQEALTSINRVIVADTFNADYYLHRANIFYNLTRYDDAIKDCYTALRIQPDKPEVFFVRGQVCMVTKSYGGAILFFGKTIKNTSSNDLLFNAYLSRGEAFYSLGKYSEAIADYKLAAGLNPVSSDLNMAV